MKKYISLLLLLSIFCSLSAQQIAVKSFRKLETDLDARLSETALKDFNGEQSAIIKIVTIQKGFTFDCGQIGIVKTINKASEIWVYVPHGAKRISIFHEKLGQIRDWMFTEPIEKATVYELILTTGKVNITVDETIDSQWLVINPEPADASVYLNDLFVKSGTCQTKLKPGSYSYRVEAPLYHTEAGKVEITDTKKEIIAKLKPAFGYVTVNTEPEKEAKVIIDGKTLTTNSPCKSEALASGVHTVQVIKEMYQPSTQRVTITDEQTTPLNFKLQPNFAELNLTTSAEATLYVNNEQKATGNWNGRLNPGVYSLEARLDKHRSAKQDIELAAGDVKTLNLQPTPIYGSLDIISTPVGASITINGKDYGTTPNTIKNLLIGNYTLKLSKKGYKTIDKTLIVTDEKITSINEILSIGNDETAEIFYESAKSKYFSKNYIGAIVDCNKAIDLNPNYFEAYKGRGDCKDELEDYSGAIEDYTKAIEIDSKYLKAYYNRGLVKYNIKDYDGAIKDFTKVLEINPKDASTYSDRGDAKYNIKDFAGAISDYNKAIMINPKDYNAKKNILIAKQELNFIRDIDGNIYHAVKIGTQTWMVENLKTTHYQNGDEIANIINSDSWKGLSTGAWCDYNNSAANGTKYGHLYNWYATNDRRKIAPKGWHIPTNEEWTILNNYVSTNLSISSSVAKALAAKIIWTNSPNNGKIGNNLKKNNTSGFSALPGGSRDYGETYDGIGIYGYWWTSSEIYATNAWMTVLYYDGDDLRRHFNPKNYGFSVRCVRD